MRLYLKIFLGSQIADAVPIFNNSVYWSILTYIFLCHSHKYKAQSMGAENVADWQLQYLKLS